MNIVSYINATPEDIIQKRFNYWLGISLGNTYFTKEHIEQYIHWMAAHTKQSCLVVVADWIYGINLTVLNQRSKEASFRRAIRIGDKKLSEIEGIIKSLSPHEAEVVRVCRWTDIMHESLYTKRVDILMSEFEKKGKFYQRVIEIVQDNFKNNPKQLHTEHFEQLARYILYEMPTILDGVTLGEVTYNALLYPKIGLIDVLEKDLQEGVVFPEITKALDLNAPAAVIEAHVNL